MIATFFFVLVDSLWLNRNQYKWHKVKNDIWFIVGFAIIVIACSWLDHWAIWGNV